MSAVDTALLDVELFIKYNAPDRAAARLRSALETSPRSIALRERLRELAITTGQKEDAARQCLALARLYIEREDLNAAHDRLIEAKQLDPRLNIAGGLEAVRRARRPDLQPALAATAPPAPDAHYVTLAGDIALISVFDAIQVLENARLTGTLILTSDSRNGRILFNEGLIVDAEAEGGTGEDGFRKIVEITNGRFEFQTANKAFPIRITATSNTNLILDSLRQLDEANR